MSVKTRQQFRGWLGCGESIDMDVVFEELKAQHCTPKQFKGRRLSAASFFLGGIDAFVEWDVLQMVWREMLLSVMD